MSIYTMALQEVIELHGENNLGLDTYPVISEDYRTRLNEKIIDRYLNREIGHETVSLWRHAVRRKMNEIMPAYNRLYETETLIIDPLRTVDIRTVSMGERSENTEATSTGASTGGTNSTATSDTTSRQVGSDTPQTFLSGDGVYASNASDGRSGATATTTGEESATNETSSAGESTGTETLESSTTGYQGNVADLLTAYRSTILNIDVMIVDELEPLFMGILGNSMPFYPGRLY